MKTQKTMVTKNNSRVFYLDWLRVIACIAVILIHASSTYVKKDIGSFNFWVANGLDSLARIAVPLFVMISGALLLEEQHYFSFQKMLKRIKKLAVFFISWSLFYAIVFKVLPKIIVNEPIGIIDVVGTIIRGHYHLWFIYLIIGLYLILPLLRLWVKKENKKHVEYFMIIAIVFSIIIPQIITIGSYYNGIFKTLDIVLNEQLCLKYVGGYVVYFIAGWYLNNYEIKNYKLLYLLGIIGFMTTFFGTFVLSYSLGSPVQLYNDLSLNVFLPSISVFYYLKMKSIKKNNTIIASISEHSLGIYAIHVLLINAFYGIFERIGYDVAIVNIPIVFILTLVGSYAISFILSYIPILRKIV